MRRLFKIGYLAVLLAGAAMFTSCITDEHLTGPGDCDGQREITFAVKVPGSTDATRALRETDETRITRVDVLVFEAGANGKFLYSAYAKDNGSNTYTVRLRESANASEKFDVMMVANASSIISTAYSSGIPANTSRAEILQTLTYTLPADTPFPSMQSPTYTMPMWGMTEALLVNGSTTSKTIRLHRMVAKIDVGLDDAVTSSTFKLNSVRLYNYNQTGRLIPDPGNGNFTSTAPITEGDYTTYPKATAPSLKTGSTLTEGPVVYGNGEMTLTARKMEGAIYAFEASKGAHWDGSGGGDFTDNTCLVVGGFYGNQSSTETFYRIDFVKSNGTFLHLLRNHIYRVNIKSVSGAGFTSPEAAFQSRPVNITSEIIPWVDGEMTEVGFDGQYTLAISQNKYEFTAAGGTQTLTVKTDYPDGWTTKVCNASGVELTGTAKWVSPSPSSRSTAGEETITITAQPNTDIEDRPAYIHITAGRITLKVEVTQKKYVWNGRSADILYWDESTQTLRVGHWGLESDGVTYGHVTSNNMIYTKFGGVVGFIVDPETNGTGWNKNRDIKFNPVDPNGTQIGNTYGNVQSETTDSFTRLPFLPSFSRQNYRDDGVRNVSMGTIGVDPMNTENAPAYHTLANIKIGRGDICRLVGMDVNKIKTEFTTDEQLYDYEAELKAQGIGGWRLPTAWENYKFVGYDDWAIRTPTRDDRRSNNSYRFWSTNSTSPAYRLEVSSGVARNGSYLPTGIGSVWAPDGEFLPAAGCRARLNETFNSTASSHGERGHYWSSTPNDKTASDWTTGLCLYFGDYLGSDIKYMIPANSSYVYHGFSIRCVRDE